MSGIVSDSCIIDNRSKRRRRIDRKPRLTAASSALAPAPSPHLIQPKCKLPYLSPALFSTCVAVDTNLFQLTRWSQIRRRTHEYVFLAVLILWWQGYFSASLTSQYFPVLTRLLFIALRIKIRPDLQWIIPKELNIDSGSLILYIRTHYVCKMTDQAN